WGFLFNPTGPFLNRCLARFYPGVDSSREWSNPMATAMKLHFGTMSVMFTLRFIVMIPTFAGDVMTGGG
ncbi:hypothetical protein, partial [Novosphingobium sp.]|uniref:hypothetical protein n=1 Tax=Novosphingobium sp. TaxID=1874826 RepID=UPI001DAFE208